MKSDFFFSKSTSLYVARNPLKIDARVKIASETAYVRMNWMMKEESTSLILIMLRNY